VRAVIVAVLLAGAVQVAPEPSLKDVLRRAGDYSVRFGETFATVLGEETYTQQLVLNQTQQVLESRRLQSDIAFLRLSGSTEWLGLRSVTSVDGEAVSRAGRLEAALFGEDGSFAQARAIADESARHNLGPLRRNFNVPTLVLQFLHPDNRDRFRFTRKETAEHAGEPVWVVAFEERGRSTFIRAPNGKDLPSEGRIWMAPAEGRVVRTELVIDDFHPPVRVRRPTPQGTRSVSIRSRARIEVQFRFDAHLRQWVPGEMRERYAGAWSAGSLEQEQLHYSIVGTATYANYRRFDVDVRIRD
jgi:hypothetical protein